MITKAFNYSLAVDCAADVCGNYEEGESMAYDFMTSLPDIYTCENCGCEIDEGDYCASCAVLFDRNMLKLYGLDHSTLSDQQTEAIMWLSVNGRFLRSIKLVRMPFPEFTVKELHQLAIGG